MKEKNLKNKKTFFWVSVFDLFMDFIEKSRWVLLDDTQIRPNRTQNIGIAHRFTELYTDHGRAHGLPAISFINYIVKLSNSGFIIFIYIFKTLNFIKRMYFQVIFL